MHCRELRQGDPAGSEGSVTLTIDSKGFAGPITKTAQVISEDPEAG